MPLTPDHKPSVRDDWGTPQHIFELLNRFFGPFTLDPASDGTNALCPLHYTEKENGLVQSWAGHRVFLNPPYGRILYQWARKAYLESRHPRTIVVGLLPARTDPKWFHDYIFEKSKVILIPGRIKFVGAKYAAPFPSMYVIWGRDTERLENVKHY